MRMCVSGGSMVDNKLKLEIDLCSSVAGVTPKLETVTFLL